MAALLSGPCLLNGDTNGARIEILIFLSFGLFTQGEETGQPSYSLRTCDIPNQVAGPELALKGKGK
jgi:hypothetical protein